MAKKVKKPVKKVEKKPKAAAAPKKPVKTTVLAKPKKAAVPVAAKGKKETPKTVEVKKGPMPVAPVAKKEKPKKSKKSSDDDVDFFDEEFEDVDLEGVEDFKNKSQEEIEEIRALIGDTPLSEDEVEIALRDAEGRLYCKVRDCDELSIVDGYCRYHYLKLWKRIQLRKKILTDGKLEKYIEELTQRYPDKYIEMIRDDLRSEKAFTSVIQELEIEDAEEETEVDDDQSLIDEVRGTQTSGGDEDDSF